MAKLAYITGSSRGIGKALALLLLDKGYKVIGLSRTNDIQHPNFQFHAIDLSDINAVKNFQFDSTEDNVLLVNNAGMLGEVGPIGQIDNGQVCKVMNVNTISPQILTNSFITKFHNNRQQFHILNISSGAGKRPISSWATYCASKAALDLFSETVAEELEWKQMNNWFIHSVAPGVVDTKMQEQIRSTDKENFKIVQNFIDYKENNDLYTPQHVAEKLWKIIETPSKFSDVLQSVREY